MCHKKNVDYAYLLWEEFFYQVETKNAKKGNDMYYPCFTKVIVNFFMSKDQSIPRRNWVNWHFAKDDPMFTTIKVISRHEDTQLYGASLPDELTNEAIKDSESYKEYYAIASGAEPPKTKASVNKKLNTSAKEAKPAKKKQSAKTSKAKGLTVLSEVALTEPEQMKLAIKRSLIQTHNSHASGSGIDEGTSGKQGVLDVPSYGSDDEQISWKSSGEEDANEVSMNDDDDENDNNDDNELTESDNDYDDIVHPKLSTFDEEERQDEDDKEEKWSDDEAYDEETQGGNDKKQKMDEEETHEDEEVNELYRDVNINLERRDTEMAHANVQATQVIEDTHVIITVVTLENTESTSLVDVPVTTNAEMPPSATTLPPPPTPLIQPLQHTPVSTPTVVPRDTVTFKRRQDDEDEDEEPSAGSNRGSKRRRAGKEPKSTSAPKEKTSKSSGKSKEGSRSHQ
ncbi:hypothetical protein Tco_0367976 [Tanacetum coccineum]